jgi:hypothetical protein
LTTLFAFVHIPKTAGSTISAILRQSFRTAHCDIRLGKQFDVPPLSLETLRRTRRVYRRLRSIAGHGVLPRGPLHEAREGMQFYTFLRDPLVRCASEYQYLVQRDGLAVSFDQWIRTDPARNRMTKMLCGREDAEAAVSMFRQGTVGFVGLTERFNESLVLLRKWFHEPALDIRYRAKNVMADNQIKNQLLASPATRGRLLDANREDVILYRHVVQALYPRQMQAYGPTLSSDVGQFEAGNRRPMPYPRQLPSLLLRELIYKPLAPRLACCWR